MITIRQADGAAPEPGLVAEALRALEAGLLVIYPTETLYALGGVATAAVAVRVRAAKGREEGKPLPLVAADAGQASRLCAVWGEQAERLAAAFWPGPLTLVLRAGAEVPAEITAGTGSVAVRVPGLALPRELCRRAGPLVSTSANRSGEPPHALCAPAVAAVGAHAALALDAGSLPGQASTILDLTRQPRLVRAGAVPVEALARALRTTVASLQTGTGRGETTP